MASKAQVLTWLRLLAPTMEAQKDHLTELDAAIGDADHGINMTRGFKKVVDQLPQFEGKDIGEILKGTGMALISSVGGASGPLYGTFFLRAGTALAGKNELSEADWVTFIECGLQGVVDRGKAQAGEKTMIDALEPARDALKKALEIDGKALPEALGIAVAAAEQGVHATIPMRAKKGRASYLGERSIDHQDPGATSTWLILKALHEVLQ